MPLPFPAALLSCLVLGFALCAPLRATAQTDGEAGAEADLADGGPRPLAYIPVDDARRTFTAEEEEFIREHLRDMDCLIPETVNETVESYIKGYMIRNRAKAETILGRIPTYFPLFEAELRRAGLPEDLKYVALLESALDPTALSRSGAGGLWQFMPATAVMFGLAIDSLRDERGDPAKATRAAVAYFQEEYERFGDWALVLAAYNGGPSRVRRAMRRSGSKDFWKLRRFLPRETRNYVPAFIAANYLHRYGRYHGIRERRITFDEQLVAEVACPTGATLTEVAQATRLSVDLVRALNPQYLLDHAPPGPRSTVRVPARTREALGTYLDWRASGRDAELVTDVREREPITGFPNNDHFYAARTITMKDSVATERVAAEQRTTLHHLRSWNPDLGDYLVPGQRIKVYAPRFTAKTPFDGRPLTEYVLIDRGLPYDLVAHAAEVPEHYAPRAPTRRRAIARYESLAEFYEPHAASMTWAELLRWNGLEAGDRVRGGTELWVRGGTELWVR